MVAAKKSSLTSIENKFRAFALDYPGTNEDFPWGHSAFKVNKKVFLFLAHDKGELSLSVKLPKSGKSALKRAFASPTEYGLGKHGWLTLRFMPGDNIPVHEITSWIDESFRAIAPKKIVAFLDEADAEVASAKPRARPRSRQS